METTSKMLREVTDNGGSITKQITQIAKASDLLHRKIAVCAASCALHVVKHGNVTVCTNLVNALGGAMRKNALVAWFEVYAPVVWNKEEKKFVLNHNTKKEFKAKVGKDEKGYISACMAETFWEFKPEPEYDGFDFMKALEQLIKRADGVKTDPKKKDHKKTDLTGLEEVRALFGG